MTARQENRHFPISLMGRDWFMLILLIILILNQKNAVIPVLMS